MKTKVVTLYEFDELSDKAKETARDWWREHIFSDDNDWEATYEDAITIGEILGIKISTRGAESMGGKELQYPCIFFSGFSSQGDGASFEGWYEYAEDAPKKIREHAPMDNCLHGIADELEALQKKNANCLRAKIKSHGNGCASYNMDVDMNFMENDEGVEQSDDAEKELTRLMRDFADWIYGQLEAEYEYQCKDETIDENIRANEYTFLENGKRED